ncbi:MAG: BamA/TamA family outer membrane protein [Mariprofundus sp.]|nr:BamA/TamA family outer membrane protein [Mariprofundus sp.]
MTRACRKLILLLLLSSTLLCWLPVWASEKAPIIDSPIAIPESLIKGLEALRVKPNTNSSVIRHLAMQDAILIRQWLRSKGYLDCQVSLLTDKQTVRYRVHSGVLWRIHQLLLSPHLAVKVKLPIAREPFDSEQYEKQKTALLWSWRDAGYLKAKFAKAAVIPEPNSKQVDIHWQIIPGPIFTISQITVTGNQQYAAELAINISRLQLGEVATQQRLQDAMQNIAADSRYQHATILPQLRHPSATTTALLIQVKEAGWRTLSGDINYATDSGIGVASHWVDRSLQQGKLEYALRGEASRSTVGTGATLTLPTWPSPDQKVGINADFLHKNSDGRRYSSLSGGPFWQYQFNRRDHLRFTLQAENNHEAGRNVLTLGPRIELLIDRASSGMISEHGWRLNASISLPQRVNRPGFWPMFDLSGRLFFTPTSYLLLSPRAGFGRTLQLQTSVPKSYRQFAGGAASARGYALDSLGTIGSDGLASGGLMKTFAGLDLIFQPDSDSYSPVLFSDVAKVWQTVGSASPTAWSVGAGIIIHTAAGPLRIDLATPLKRRLWDKKLQFYLSLGNLF